MLVKLVLMASHAVAIVKVLCSGRIFCVCVFALF